MTVRRLVLPAWPVVVLGALLVVGCSDSSGPGDTTIDLAVDPIESPTNDWSPTVSGITEAGATVTVASPRDTLTDLSSSSGAFSSTVRLQTDDVNTITVLAVDSAGNEIADTLTVAHDGRVPLIGFNSPDQDETTTGQSGFALVVEYADQTNVQFSSGPDPTSYEIESDQPLGGVFMRNGTFSTLYQPGANLAPLFGLVGDAGANLLVVGDDKFYNSFVDEVTEAASKIVIGYGLDESVQMGPMRDKEKKDGVVGYIESGLKEGAKLRLDGRKFKIKGDYPDTCFVGPSIFEDVTPDMKIGEEEIFGPVMSVMRAKDLDEAIDVVNACDFANGHGIFTSSGKSAREFQYRVISGNVGINIGIVAPMAFFPFSGMRDSFLGILHTQGQEAVRFFTESKVVIQRWF